MIGSYFLISGTYGIRIKSCYAFSKLNSSVLLIDDRGCPVQPGILGAFSYEQALGRAEADLHSMFRFPGSGELHFQCDVAVCTRGRCPEPQCDDDQALGRSLATPTTDDGVLIASTSVFVLEPGEQPLVSPVCEDGTVRIIFVEKNFFYINFGSFLGAPGLVIVVVRSVGHPLSYNVSDKRLPLQCDDMRLCTYRYN